MPAESILPHSADLRLVGMRVEGDAVVLELESTRQESACPSCGRLSRRGHNWTRRTLGDLPWAAVPIVLHVHLRNFRCVEPDCPQRFFTERRPELAPPYAHATLRRMLAETAVGVGAGGEPGARLLRSLGIGVSGDTLLRRVRKAPEPPVPKTDAVGIDDWAWRRGQRYGSIRIDLRSHRSSTSCRTGGRPKEVCPGGPNVVATNASRVNRGEEPKGFLNRSRLVLLASGWLIVAIPIAYCAARYNPRPTALTPQQALAEYRAEAASLTLAPDWKWPASPVPSHAPDGPATTYGKGWGRQAADSYWFCSWASRALDPKLPAAERQQAIENALSIRTKYLYTTALAPDSKRALDRLLRNAAKGDTRDLRQYYEANCSKNP
ncbi:MAG: transposase family protein [Chloroflexi bacterium]|nr:transposase family protein [Chloroflexota bacterium]